VLWIQKKKLKKETKKCNHIIGLIISIE